MIQPGEDMARIERIEALSATIEALGRREITTAQHGRIDALEQSLLDSGLPAVDLPLIHRFTPGVYVREIFMPAGTLLTSKIHRTEHPYVVLSGVADVYIPGVGVERLVGGHVGVTKANTRRVLYIREDCRWITFHPITEEEAGNVDLIEQRIIEPRELPDGRVAFEAYQQLLAEGAAAILEAFNVEK